ncbi:MAG: hypothetical protein NQU46_05605 [Methanolinea sp.]|nr:hypothetical protein [Methanolinea sp.]
MDSITLKVQERAFPSRGRARLNESHLKSLGIGEGDEVEVSAPGGKKPVVVTVFADTLVEVGYIRLSPDDMAQVGARSGSEVNVTRRPPVGERMKKTAEETRETLKADVKKARETISSKTASVKGTVEKEVESVKKGLHEKSL